MALERRVQRRSHADAILSAFDALEKSRGNRFFRAMISDGASATATGFCILLMKRSIAPDGTSYGDYRELRAATLQAYTWNLLEKNRHLKRVVGLATEGIRRGKTSEDLIYHEASEWTDEEVKNAKEHARLFKVFQSDSAPKRISVLEYPASDKGLRGNYDPIPYQFVPRPATARPVPVEGNRRARRAARARLRKTNVTE